MSGVLDPLTQLNFGSIEKARSYLVLGERGTGKTMFCMLATLKFSLENSKVFYVSTQDDVPFRLGERLLLNHGISKAVLDNITLMKLVDRASEASVPLLLENIRPSLFVFDEANWGYGSYVAENVELAVHRNRLLSNLLAEIHSVCRSIGCTTIYTADILSGGRVLAHNVLTYFSDLTIELKRSRKEYRARLVGGGLTLKSYSYTIGKLGFQIGGRN